MPARTRAAAISRLVDQVAGAHVPGEGRMQIAGRLEMFGDQRRILISRVRLALFDCGGHPPVQLGAIRFELRFVGHRTNERVVERHTPVAE